MTILLLQSGPGRSGGGGPVAGAEAAAFLARTSGLDTTHINAYTILINGLVTDGVWAKLDALYIFATQDSTTAALNLVSATYNGTVNGSPSFTADRGFTGVAASSTVYFNSNFNAATATSPKYVLNSAHLAVWSLTNGNSANAAIGANDASTFTFLYTRHTDNNSYYRVNSSNAGTAYATSNADAFWIMTRETSVSSSFYKNGTSVSTNAASSVGIQNRNVYVLAYDNNGTAQGTPEQLTMASIGAALTSTDATNFYNRLRTYMTAMGVP